MKITKYLVAEKLSENTTIDELKLICIKYYLLIMKIDKRAFKDYKQECENGGYFE